MKIAKITTILPLLLASGGGAWAQDINPRGPSDWTTLNWVGFCLQLGLFILGIALIFWVAGSGSDNNS